MKMRIELSEEEMKTAVVRHLEAQGFSNVQSVSFSREGYTDSPDPRENVLTFSASASADPPKRK